MRMLLIFISLVTLSGAFMPSYERSTVDQVTPGPSTTTIPTPTDVQPTPTFVQPTPTTQLPSPTPDSQTRLAAGVVVRAERFVGGEDSWTTSGTVYLGNYVVVAGASLSGNPDTITGVGQVTLLNSKDGGSSSLFEGSFGVSTAVLRPTSGTWLYTNVYGFTTQVNPNQATLLVNQGVVNVSMDFTVALPGNELQKTLSVTLDHTGTASGTLSNAEFALGVLTLNVQQAQLSKEGFSISEGTLAMPNSFGGARANATDLTITSKGELQVGALSGAVTIPFPNIKIGGARGFAIEEASVTIQSTNDGTYLFTGVGTFLLPGVGKLTGCTLGTRFTFATNPPPFREASLQLAGCVRVPIGATGFFITSVEGSVQLDEQTTAVDMALGITSFELPKVGPVISGRPNAHWDTSWKAELSGSLKLFSFDVAESALTLSKARGLEGVITIDINGVVTGDGSLHIWSDRSKLHVTGSFGVGVVVPRGALVDDVFIIPPEPIKSSARMDLGEFQIGSATEYGLKGRVSLWEWETGLFVSAAGDLDFGELSTYQLVAPARSARILAGSDVRQFTVAPNTPALIAGLATQSAAPTLHLVAPDGRTLDASSPEVVATITPGQTLLSVANPMAGSWTVGVESSSSAAQYQLAVFGARAVATIAPPTITANADGSYTISLAASSATPTSTLSLFYDTSSSARTGVPLVQSLPLSTTTYRWQPTFVADGTYQIYAMVDDPLGTPAYAYATTPITVRDRTPPDAPRGLQVQRSGTSAVISWQPSNAADVAGYRIYYTTPGSSRSFVTELADWQQTSVTQSGLHTGEAWDFTISAYDINDNESARSSVGRDASVKRDVYLPLIARESR